MEPKRRPNHPRWDGGALEDGGRPYRPRRDRDGPTAHDQGEGWHIRLPHGGTHADRATIFDHDSIDGAVDDDAGTPAISVHQVGLERGLLGADLASVATEATPLILRAPLDVARHVAGVPAQPLHAPFQDSLARAHPAVIGVNPEAFVDGIHRRAVVIARKGLEPEAVGPFLTHPVRSAEARRVV